MKTRFLMPALIPFLASCALIPSLNHHDSEVIATDLVSALSQVPEKKPDSTTVSFVQNKSDFQSSVLKQLTKHGYGLREIEPKSAKHHAKKDLLTHQQVTLDDEREKRTAVVKIAVGQVSLSREYDILGKVSPISGMSISNSSTQNISLEKNIFNAENLVEINASSSAETSPVKPVLVEAAPDTTYPEINIRDLKGPPVEPHYETVTEKTIDLGFAQSDLNLLNKKDVKDVANLFVDKTDLIYVVGCSHGGKTSKPNGNEILAHRRAHRVVEEFISHGIKKHHIVSEGCFEPVAPKGNPSRGVKIKLVRFN